MRLAGKNAIVTGAGSGIGRAIAERLGEEGAAVAVADINVDAGARTAQDLRAKGVRAINIPTDVSDPGRVERLVATAVSSLDRLDIFINNAGINFVKPMIATSVEDWNRVITTDLGGTFFGCGIITCFARRK